MDDMQDQDEIQPARYGYGKFYRKVTDTPVFNDLAMLQLYVVISRDAAIKERHAQVWTGRGYASVNLMPGEFLSRRKSTAKMLGWDDETYRKRLEKLIKFGVVKVVRVTSHGKVLILEDFSDFGIDQKSSVTTLNQDALPPQKAKSLPPKINKKSSVLVGDEVSKSENVTTLNQDSLPPKYQPSTSLVPALEKSIKGLEKKEKSIGAVRPIIEEVVAFSKEQNFKSDPNGFFNHFEANGWVQTSGNKIKNWKAAFRNWECNHIKWNPESKPTSVVVVDDATKTAQWLIDKQTVRMAEPMRRK